MCDIYFPNLNCKGYDPRDAERARIVEVMFERHPLLKIDSLLNCFSIFFLDKCVLKILIFIIVA